MAEGTGNVPDIQDFDDKIQTGSDTDFGVNSEIPNRTKLLRDTLELLVNRSDEQRKQCDQLSHENRYLQDYIENLMSQGNVLDK
ncbi:Slo1p LALA0_S07e06502g [Lachancea lanzarotensis]|uniref:LALA0S07e06502g1_1 n=1 Tax=Lachancea lanzarotensis TaxID=1245769 RepID=A0A0C7N5P4_9SACH|nr:uncharacterized protein LALA0_S07e06502g [Lachancea lanzarotensis]CEP63278.1 LALA0S07e06502g1_1 [Lachancea lanzarotensis]